MHREVLSCPRCLFICLFVCLLVCFAFAGWLVGWLVGGLLVMCMCVISGNTRCGPNSCYTNASLARHTITCTPSPYICLVQAHNGHVLLPKVYICLLPYPGPPQPVETRKRAAEAIQERSYDHLLLWMLIAPATAMISYCSKYCPRYGYFHNHYYFRCWPHYFFSY